jgi:2-oxoglutarate decarboxylase
VRWVQDEPSNMGPWPHYQLNVWPHVDARVELISRPESSSPAVGTVKRHTEEQKDLVARAFA